MSYKDGLDDDRWKPLGERVQRGGRGAKVPPFTEYASVPNRPGWFHDYHGHFKYDPFLDPTEVQRRRLAEKEPAT